MPRRLIKNAKAHQKWDEMHLKVPPARLTRWFTLIKQLFFQTGDICQNFLYLGYFNVFAYDVKCETTDVAGDKTD